MTRHSGSRGRFENKDKFRRLLKPNNESVFHRRYDEAVKHVQSRFGKRYPMLINGKSRSESGKSRFVAVPDVDDAIDFIRYYCTELVSNKGPVQGAVTGNTSIVVEQYPNSCRAIPQ
jgi:hypothetical protein